MTFYSHFYSPSFRFVAYYILLCATALRLNSCIPDNATHLCETIYLLNVVPYPDDSEFAGWDRGFELIPAGHLATKHINNRTDILNGQKLEVITISSEACGRRIPVDGYLGVYEEMMRSTCVGGIIGLYCSAVTAKVAPLFSHSRYGYIQLAAATSPLLRDSNDYPHLFHTIASSAVFNAAMIAMMDAFNWMRVSVIYDSMQFYFKSTGRNFEEQIKLAPDKVLLSNLPILETEKSDLFSEARTERLKIVYYSVTEKEGSRVMCEIFKRGLIWPDYVHIFLERTVDELLNSTNSNCTVEELRVAIEGVFVLDYRLQSTSDSPLVSGLSYEAYHQEYLEELHRFSNETGMNLQENGYANYLYDQVWAFALAMNASLDRISLMNESFENAYEKTPELRDLLALELKNISFDGVSGLIEFGERKEVQTFVDIFQIRNGGRKLIGVFDPYSNEIVNFDIDGQDIPSDTFDTKPNLVPSWISYPVLLIQGILFIIITVNTILLVYLRKKPEIKSSSLYVSLIILTGCYLLCLSPVLNTVLSSFDIDSTTVFTVLCNAELWLSINGLSIVFVALLFRLLRIYRIFRSYHPTGKYWSDKYIISYIVAVCSISMLLLIIWIASDHVHKDISDFLYVPINNMQKNASNLVSKSSVEPPFYLEHSYCSRSAQGVWFLLTYFWIGLILALVVILAIKTRHIKRGHYKDTKKVNMFIFCVLIIFTTFIPLSEILFAVNVIVGAYVLKWLAYFLVSFLCQLFLFVPKILPIFISRKDQRMPHIAALVKSTLRVEGTSNTSV